MGNLAGTAVNYRKLILTGDQETKPEAELVVNCTEIDYVLDSAEGVRKSYEIVTHRITMNLVGATYLRDYMQMIVDDLTAIEAGKKPEGKL